MYRRGHLKNQTQSNHHHYVNHFRALFIAYPMEHSAVWQSLQVLLLGGTVPSEHR